MPRYKLFLDYGKCRLEEQLSVIEVVAIEAETLGEDLVEAARPSQGIRSASVNVFSTVNTS